MSVRGPRLEFAVGAFLLLALASLLVLALASTNGKFGFGAHTYPLKARFTNLGQLRTSAQAGRGNRFHLAGGRPDAAGRQIHVQRRWQTGHGQCRHR